MPLTIKLYIMNKYLYLLLVTLLTSVSFALVSCGDDDEPTFSNGTIEINGVSYKLTSTSDLLSISGWHGTNKSGNLYLQTVDENDTFYEFWYESNTEPVVGDDFATMSLKMSFDEISNPKYKYVSGSAIITNSTTEDEDKYIVIKFDKLNMSDGSDSFVFNGSAKLKFVRYDN